MRRTTLASLFVGVLAVSAVGVTATAAVALHRPAQTTTSPGGETTTIEPTTLAPTTLAPTTTIAPETTTTGASTTTSSSTTTTTVAPASTSSGGSSTPWGWIIGIVLLILAAIVTMWIVVRKNAKRDKGEWSNATASTLRDADLTRDMLTGEARPGQVEDAARLNTVRDNVERVATTFDGLAASAPDDEARRNSIALATSLRGYFFALQAEQLLHEAPTPPSGEQLAATDATRRMRIADLDGSIAAIRAYVTPPEPGR